MRYILILIFALFAAAAEYSNDLIYEESPYLRQHAHNPVNWLPWGKRAFEKAKKEHKPIFLSIGYSSCHWCHVMERESFENEEIAQLLNRYYVPIKVDREERPDLDRYYQLVYYAMHHRSGGWPLTIIMTEEKKPFFSATYLPPEDGYGVKGMKTILPLLAKAYKEDKKTIEKRADAVIAQVQTLLSPQYKPVELRLDIAKRAIETLKRRFDPIYGGFSKRIKFPQASTIELLLDIYELTGNKEALAMATKTLESMAKGGIFDQIEGGFFRYSTDREWILPHFEKMLYTNATLIEVYTHAYILTKNPLYKEVVQRTIANIDERLQSDNLYYAASSADSEGEEGKYFLLEYDKALQALRKEGYSIKEAKKELAALGIEEEGNYDTVLSNPIQKGSVSKKTLEILKKVRSKVAYPFIDTTVIAAWNAMYIKSKLDAFIIAKRYKKEALHSLDRLLARLYKKGVLYHQCVGRNPPKKRAFLEDYAYLIDTLLDAYEVSLKPNYLQLALKLYQKAKKEFYKNGRWYFSLQEPLLPVRLDDSRYPSAYAILLNAMMKMAALNYDLVLFNQAKKEIEQNSALILNEPASYPTLTIAALRLKAQDVVVKSNKEKLIANLAKIWMIPYPFLLDKEENLSHFEACSMQSCFASGSLEEIKKAIELRLHPKRKQWKIGFFPNR